MKKQFIFTAAILLSVGTVIAQPPIHWEKAFYGTSTSYSAAYIDVIQTSDGGFLAVGNGKGTGGDLPNGGYLDKGDVLITKMNASGATQWTKYWGGAQEDFVSSVLQTPDGGYILTGRTKSTIGGTNNGGYDGFVLKIDATGTIEWNKLYGGSLDDQINAICRNPDGSFVFVGKSKSPEIDGAHGNEDLWVGKISETGTLLWSKAKGYSGYDEGTSIAIASDGSYIVAGTTTSTSATNHHGGSDIWLLKISTSGAISWQTCIGGSGSESFGKAIIANDGSIIVTGSSTSNNGDVSGQHGDADVLLAKTDNMGNVLFAKLFGGSDGDIGMGIALAEDGGYFIGARTKSSDGDITNLIGSYDAWVIKTSSAGLMKWQKTYGGAGIDLINNFSITNDGGLILAGQQTNKDGWILKLKGNTTNINDISNELKVSVYPNPTSQILNVLMDWSQAKKGNLQILDINGRVLHNQSLEVSNNLDLQLDISNLIPGSYYLKISTEKGQKSNMFQVLR
ncbi:MAG TPA: T9SS type A sorting domain-containing protein [Edaphocola sp.]|nr:T9SS type A sorting domain-containing protein [Edaphocola sp.]